MKLRARKHRPRVIEHVYRHRAAIGTAVYVRKRALVPQAGWAHFPATPDNLRTTAYFNRSWPDQEQA